MSTRSTMHHMHAIGSGVGSLMGSMMIDMIAARRQDIVIQRMAARRARIEVKLQMIRELRAKRMAR